MAEEKSTEEVKEPNPAPASYSRDVMKLVLNLIAFHIKYNFFVNLSEKGEVHPEDIKDMEEVVKKAVNKVTNRIYESEEVANNYLGRKGINEKSLRAIVNDIQLSLRCELECMVRGDDDYHIIKIGEWWNLIDLVTPKYDRFNTFADRICEILELLLFNDAYVKKCDAIRKLQQYRELWQLIAPLEAKYFAGVFDKEFVLPEYSNTTIEGRDKREVLAPGMSTLGFANNPHNIQRPISAPNVTLPKQQ